MGEKNKKIKLDTYFGSDWKTFKYLAERQKFKIAYQKEFVDRNLPLIVGSVPSVEEEKIYFNEKGIILYSYSDGKRIGRADCYLEIKTNGEGLTEEEFNVLHSCAATYDNSYYKNNVVLVRFDAKECFIQKLEKILETFEISKEWNIEKLEKHLPLWFLNVEEEQINGDNYEKITREKIEACVPEAKRIIFG